LLYELRIYDIAPGKNKALIDRFANHALLFFKKHGLKPVLFLNPMVGIGQQLVYILEWNSLDEYQKGWAGMGADAEWSAIKAETEKDGPLVLRITNSLYSDVPPIMSRIREIWG